MFVRLAFAAAISVDPDIFIIDEALAVGDAAFQNKCLAKIREFKESGKTLLFVSHDAAAVQNLCDRAFLIDKGRMVVEDKPKEIIKIYNNLLALQKDDKFHSYNGLAQSSGNHKIVIEQVRLINQLGVESKEFYVGEKVKLEIKIKGNFSIKNPTVGFSFHDKFGREAFGVNNANLGSSIGDIQEGEHKVISYSIDLFLGVNSYSLSVSCHPGESHLIENYHWCNNLLDFRVVPCPDKRFVGACWLNTTVKSEKYESQNQA